MPTRIQWSGDRQVRVAMGTYAQRVKQAEENLAQFYAAKMQTDARRDAPWTDRTGNARQALRGYTNSSAPEKYGASDTEYPNPNDLAKDTVALYLSHGMKYGVALETKYSGRYAIIMQTIQSYYPEITRQLQRLFK
jgi:hypothetical protein